MTRACPRAVMAWTMVSATGFVLARAVSTDSGRVFVRDVENNLIRVLARTEQAP